MAVTDWRHDIQPERILRGPRLEGDVRGCVYCGLPEATHPATVYGLNHFSTSEEVPLGFVAPSDELVALRIESRQVYGLPIAEVDEQSGRPKTHLVRATCRCGQDAVCTPERVEGARCGACVLTDAGERTATPGYDMTDNRGSK